MIFPAQAGHWEFLPKDGMPGKIDYTDFNKSSEWEQPSVYFPVGKHVLSLFSLNINNINIVLNIDILYFLRTF